MRRRTFLATAGTAITPIVAGCVGVHFKDIDVHNIGERPLTISIELTRVEASSPSLATRFDLLTDNVPWSFSTRFEPGERRSWSDLLKATGDYRLAVDVEDGPTREIEFTIPTEARPLNELKGIMISLGLTPSRIHCKHHPAITLGDCRESESFGFSQSEPVGDGSAAPAPSCPDGYQSYDPWWVVEGSGPLGGFDLALDGETYEHGDELVAELRNVTDEEQMTGVKQMFDIQYQDGAGWHTIFDLPDNQDPIWPLVGLSHPPGDGFTWRLTLTQASLSDGEIESAESYHVCQPLKPGQYRFVYWGITTEQEREEDFETDYALGEPFTVA